MRRSAEALTGRADSCRITPGTTAHAQPPPAPVS